MAKSKRANGARSVCIKHGAYYGRRLTEGGGHTNRKLGPVVGGREGLPDVMWTAQVTPDRDRTVATAGRVCEQRRREWYVRGNTSPSGVLAALARYLGEIVARGSRSAVRAFGGGAVIKVPDPDTPVEWILAEAEHVEAVRAAGAPAPRLLGLEKISGRAATVWERLDGISMWQCVIERPELSAQMGRVLADVQLGLFDLVPPVTLPSQRDRLESKIRRAAASVDPSLASALDLLPPRSGPLRLCHGDMHPSNVLLTADGPMVVDWFDASRGEPIVDVARSLLLLGDGKHMPAHLPGADAATLEVLTHAYVARLRERLELGDDALALWQAINAVARLAEGLPHAPLLEVWNRFELDSNRARPAQAAAS